MSILIFCDDVTLVELWSKKHHLPMFLYKRGITKLLYTKLHPVKIKIAESEYGITFS